jgi:hypothetical protein
MHWSDLGPAHAAIADSINPLLNERNLVWFLLRQYLIAPVFPSMGTQQIGSVPNEVDEVRSEYRVGQLASHGVTLVVDRKPATIVLEMHPTTEASPAISVIPKAG